MTGEREVATAEHDRPVGSSGQPTPEGQASEPAAPSDPAGQPEPVEAGSAGVAVVVKPRVLAPVLAAIACIAATVVVWKVFVGTERGQMVEEAARIGSEDTRDAFSAQTTFLLNAVSIPALVLVIAGAVLVGLFRRRWSIAIAAIVVLCGANLTTQVLQEWLTRPEPDASPIHLNSFPSGHATVAASVAATALLVVPARWRWPVALLGALLSGAMGISTMIGTAAAAWHRGSDVAAAMLITAAWYFAAEAVLAALVLRAGGTTAERHGRTTVPVRVLTFVGGLTGALGIGALAATAVRAPELSDLDQQVAFLGSILAAAAAACFTQMAMLRLRPHHPAPQPTRPTV